MSKKGFWGKDEEKAPETTPGATDNTADAQRPHEPLDPDAADHAKLRKQSEASAERLTKGQTTTTTPDSVEGGTVQTRTVGELDQQSPTERLKTLRGWAKDVRLGGPRSADWERFDEIVGAEETESAQSAAPTPKTGEDRRP